MTSEKKISEKNDSGSTNNQMLDDNKIDTGAGKILHTGTDMREGVKPAKEITKSQSDQDTSELIYPNRHGKNQEKISPDSKS